MSIINAYNLGLSFGARDVFAGLSVDLPDDARVGLVGPNGIGKTSLLRILAGVSAPTTGTVHRVQGTRVGYLRQEAVEAFAGREHSVYDEMLTAFAQVREQAERLREMEGRMAAGDYSDDLMATYGETQEAFEQAGGYDYDVRIRQTLEGLGFSQEQWGLPLSVLSGGQKTRALLARLLLEQPTLLILDEPTNHLDVAAIEWLETTLRAWAGALLITSHDRYFLDTVVDRVWEMGPTHIESYRGNYSAYVGQRQERWERNQQLFDTEMERLWREMELVRRYIAWRKFEEAKGKLKRLSRDLVAIERHGVLGALEQKGVDRVHIMAVEEAHQRLKAIKSPLVRPPVLRMRLKTSGRSGDIVLRTKGLRVGYGDKALYESGDVELRRLERVALIGPNGSGKTTFLRTVLGQLPPVAGEVRPGAGLKIGYFAQAHDALNGDNTVVDELLTRRDMSQGEARNHLAQYLFRGDDVHKPVKALSGGERGRLALAILALDGVNLLLLDEPTNHLDIPAQEVLQDGLEGFEGTLLMVSHDRYLVDRLATEIWELRDGRLHVFEGTYQQFLAAREGEALRLKEEAVRQRQAAPPRDKKASREKMSRADERPVSALEGQVAELEALLVRYDRRLQDAGDAGDVAELGRLGVAYAETQARLEGLMAEWMSLAAS